MANIESLHGSDKLREAYPKVNRNFNAIDKEVTDLRSRVNNIITTPIDGQAAAQEVVDARSSSVKGKTFETLDARLEEAENDLATLKAENANNIKTSVATRATNLTGEQVFVLGFKPRFIRIKAMLQNSAGFESDGSFCRGEHSLLFKYASTGGSNRVFDKIVRMHSGNSENAASCVITDTGFILNWTKYGDIPEDTILMKIDVL